MSTSIRTLIVDDDPMVLRLHAGYLAAVGGFTVVDAVGDGEAAVAAASRGEVDLVLLDRNLPGFSGVEVLHRLRAAHGHGVDVFVVSSARDRHTVRQTMSAHIAGYLLKPFTQEAFVQRMIAYREERLASSALAAEADVPLGQGEIDGMLRATPTSAIRVLPDADAGTGTGPALPKGISAPTLDAIRAALDAHRPATTAEIVAATGASRATVRRYLDHLVRTGEADLSHRYGQRGRPEVLYRLAPRL
jgi:response regulator of citrate/malate metabolism